jgi:hypothetical protein
MRENEKYKKKSEKKIFARSAVLCILAAIVCFSAILGLAAQDTGATVNVTANAPEYVLGTFGASIDVDSITGFNSGQFDMAFDSSVVNVTDVGDGSIDGATIPVSDWERLRVILDVSGIAGVNGSGNLATISFAVVGGVGAKSMLNISNGLLVNTEAEAILAEWINDEVTVGTMPVQVSVNASEYVEGTFDASVDVDSVADFNSGQFDMAFDSSVVNVTDVGDGSIDGATIPVSDWERLRWQHRRSNNTGK